MPITYSVCGDDALVVSTYSGLVTTEELLDHVRRLDDDARLPPGHRAVADLSGATGARVTVSGLIALVDEVDRRRGAVTGSTLAIVAPQDLAYGLGRAYATLGAHQRKGIGVFRTMREALGWLAMQRRASAMASCA